MTVSNNTFAAMFPYRVFPRRDVTLKDRYGTTWHIERIGRDTLLLCRVVPEGGQ